MVWDSVRNNRFWEYSTDPDEDKRLIDTYNYGLNAKHVAGIRLNNDGTEIYVMCRKTNLVVQGYGELSKTFFDAYVMPGSEYLLSMTLPLNDIVGDSVSRPVLLAQSGLFNGTSDYIPLPETVTLVGDFEIACKCIVIDNTTDQRCIISSSNDDYIRFSAKVPQIEIGGTVVQFSTLLINEGSKNVLTLVRTGSSITATLNGELETLTGPTSNFPVSTIGLRGLNNDQFDGNIWGLKATDSTGVKFDYSHPTKTAAGTAVWFDRSGNGLHATAVVADVDAHCHGSIFFGSDTLNDDGYSAGGVVGEEHLNNPTMDGIYVNGLANDWVLAGAPTISEGIGTNGTKAQVISNGSVGDVVEQSVNFVQGVEYTLVATARRLPGSTGDVCVRLLSAVIGSSTNVLCFLTEDFETERFTFIPIATISSQIRLIGSDGGGIFDSVSVKQSYPETALIPALADGTADCIGNPINHPGAVKLSAITTGVSCLDFDGVGDYVELDESIVCSGDFLIILDCSMTQSHDSVVLSSVPAGIWFRYQATRWSIQIGASSAFFASVTDNEGVVSLSRSDDQVTVSINNQTETQTVSTDDFVVDLIGAHVGGINTNGKILSATINGIRFPFSETEGTTVHAYDTYGNTYTGTIHATDIGAMWSTPPDGAECHDLVHGFSDRENLLLWSDDLTQSAWEATGAVKIDSSTFSVAVANDRIRQTCASGISSGLTFVGTVVINGTGSIALSLIDASSFSTIATVGITLTGVAEEYSVSGLCPNDSGVQLKLQYLNGPSSVTVTSLQVTNGYKLYTKTTDTPVVGRQPANPYDYPNDCLGNEISVRPNNLKACAIKFPQSKKLMDAELNITGGELWDDNLLIPHASFSENGGVITFTGVSGNAALSAPDVVVGVTYAVDYEWNVISGESVLDIGGAIGTIHGAGSSGRETVQLTATLSSPPKIYSNNSTGTYTVYSTHALNTDHTEEILYNAAGTPLAITYIGDATTDDPDGVYYNQYIFGDGGSALFSERQPQETIDYTKNILT